MTRYRSAALRAASTAFDLVAGAIFGAILLLGLVAVGIVTAREARSEPLPLAGATIETAFAPGREPAALVARAIGDGRHEVRMMTYQLTNGVIINALRAAAGRGVDVAVIVDEATCKARRFPPVADVLHRAGVGVSCDGRHPIHHNKVVLIDGTSVVTGSFNFSPSAEKNAENTNWIRNAPALAAIYRRVWEEHRAHSEPMARVR
jgi:phosphatidylserine/phosphatidylglycerophosphate/cardiolipin synthase-like enzyme